jgi:hypothetical protein
MGRLERRQPVRILLRGGFQVLPVLLDDFRDLVGRRTRLPQLLDFRLDDAGEFVGVFRSASVFDGERAIAALGQDVPVRR